jgi:hypothetical protein
MTTELLGDLGGAQTFPTEEDDAGSRDPVCGSMAASGQFADLVLFLGILGCAGA